MILYHVDRLNTIQVGQNIQMSYPLMSTQVLAKTLDELYPEGLSHHGNSYLVDPDKRMYINTNIEHIFELYRQLYFPDKPSRFQSFFCFVAPEQAIKFYNQNFCWHNEAKILKIDTGDSKIHIGDMDLLKGDTILQCHDNAMRYWSGDLTPTSTQEALVVPPAKVVDLLTP